MIQLLMIQPENRGINLFRRLLSNYHTVMTMPYLAAFVDEQYYEITIVDEYCQRIPYEKCFDLVAITVNTPNALHCYEISANFRKKGTAVVMGGPHATLLPDEVQAHCDHLLVGEGEAIWPRFLEDFRNGIAHGKYISEEVPQLHNLPKPRWDLFKRHLKKGAIFATRGCPYNCRYCNLKQVYHSSYRKRPVQEVIDEIKALPADFFVFWDDNLFVDKAYAKALLRALLPLGRRWAAQATLRDCADEELLDLAQKTGCQHLFIGLESFSEGSLSDAGKEINRIADYMPIISNIHRHGIMVYAGIVFGFDSDTASVFDKTLTACERLGIDVAVPTILTPLPKTPIYKQFKTEGRLLSEDWSKYTCKTAVVFTPDGMGTEELMRGYKRFCRQFYSFGSFVRRMRVSRTNLATNIKVNLGNRLAAYKTRKR